jgi:hypothetical protein
MLGAAILLIVQTSTGMVVNLYARIPSNPDSSQRRIFAVRSTRAFDRADTRAAAHPA